MWISKSKSTLKSQTKVDVSARQVTEKTQCLVIEGCALLWIPHWPRSSPIKPSIVMDFVNKFKDHIERKLQLGDVYLIFDRYEDYSTKCPARVSRGTTGCRVFQLHPESPLPSQKLTLTVTENKKQLIDIISKVMSHFIGKTLKKTSL